MSSHIEHEHSSPAMPSETVQPTRVNTEPQQGATQPGSGSAVDQNRNVNVVEVPAEQTKVPFKDRVVGAALQTRGTILKKPELKETGQKVLDGKMSTHEAKVAVHGPK